MLKKYLAHPLTVFFTSAIVFFWPISLFFFSLKNDALTYYYPVRILISDALRNGELPLWTPFINMGYPLHADMQSGAWNPVIWLFSFISNYSLGAFHYELLFYIAFSGIGFYYLCRNLGCSKMVAYSIAFAYQFSGFMTDSIQFFNCISAACYIPWIILFFRRMSMQHRVSDSLGLALFLFLLFTGGYPSFFIITAYVLVACTIFVFFSHANKLLFLKQFGPQVFIAASFFILLSLPAIISFVQHLSQIERGRSQSLSFVLENSLKPAASLSLLVPFATTANDSWLDSQIIMRSIYMGVIPLLFFIYAFFNSKLRKNKELQFFFIMAALMIGLAWGKFFFLRQAAYYVLPLMDSFRHPALFRFFSIFFMLLIAAAALNEWELHKAAGQRFFKTTISALLAFTLIGCIGTIIFLKNKNDLGFLTIHHLKNLFPQLDFLQRFLIQAPFLLAALLLGYLAIVKRKSIRLLCLVTIADLFFSTQLNMPVTAIGSKKFTEVETLINRNREKFPIPGNASIEENSMNTSGENVITGSTLPFIKKIGRNDYYITPGNLFMQDSFYESGIRKAVFKSPAIFFADSVVNISSNGSAVSTGPAFAYSNPTGSRTRSIIIQSFSANSMKAAVAKKEGGILVYLQNNYPGWKVFVDGKQNGILPLDISFMGVYIPPGKHEVYFCYKPAKIIAAWYVSVAGFVILLLWLAVLFFQNRDQRNAKREM